MQHFPLSPPPLPNGTKAEGERLCRRGVNGTRGGRRFANVSLTLPPDIRFELMLGAGLRGESFCCFVRQVLSEFIRPGSYPEFSKGLSRELFRKVLFPRKPTDETDLKATSGTGNMG
jgi:hypothetical protein